MSRAYYRDSIQHFCLKSPMEILGILTDQHGRNVEDLQIKAWLSEIKLLQTVLTEIDGKIYLEFSIPRMGKRVDTILLINGIVFVIEFKIGATDYHLNAIDQVMDYALDLKNFHTSSHSAPIVPMLVATDATVCNCTLIPFQDFVFHPIKSNASTLADCLTTCFHTIQHELIPTGEWETGQYHPTPTIVEAAQALYRGHNVTEITRSDAGAENLRLTSDAVENIISTAQKTKKKVICFITGVPGAGKTLAGLNIANQRLNIDDDHAVFLSGNGPLVIVLREALVRDESKQKGISKKESARKANTFIQNIHLFRDEYYTNPNPPLENVVIFDEAQRAWTQEMATKFMRQKRGFSDFNMSEPEFLIGVMDRHQDWAVIICLIGGGQEIYQGEAGLQEWFIALRNHFPNWHVYVSENITDSEYIGNQKLSDLLLYEKVTIDNRLHLAVSVRSFRSEKVSALVKAILDHKLSTAQQLYKEIGSNYPIVLTRDLHKARQWLLGQARGTERYGILASSGGLRLRPEGLFVRNDLDVSHWFLDGKEDVRSSYALEEVATEFDIQGLELDWTAVAWDADLRSEGDGWAFKSFLGNRWQNIKKDSRRKYLKNAYRVLLTRARQGMVIFIPEGIVTDHTRLPAFYDDTYEYLLAIGMQTLS